MNDSRRNRKDVHLSSKGNKVMLGLNVFLFVCALILAVFNVYYKEYIVAGAMFLVLASSGVNIRLFWKKLKSQSGQ